jgi:hypothetical protein
MFDGKDPVSGYTEWKAYKDSTGHVRGGGCGTGFYAMLFFILIFLGILNELCKAGVSGAAAFFISASVTCGIFWLVKRLKK